MYATVFLILVRQRRRARAALTLCAQCRHKYAIYASVWPYPCLRGRTCESQHLRVFRSKDVWVTARAPYHVCVCTCVYCTVKRGPTFPRAATTATTPGSCRRFLPWILFVFRTSSTLFPSTLFPNFRPDLPFVLPTAAFTVYFSLSRPFRPGQPNSVPLLPSGLNCCNLWPMPVDLTVELRHGDLYGLLILHRCRGWNLAMGFHRFSTTTCSLYAHTDHTNRGIE